jgi:DNA-binding MarR family transcriptional regulator
MPGEYDPNEPRLSPSARLVLKVLESNGWMTQKQISDQTSLPPRTVKYAIKKLKETARLQEKPNLCDMRGKFYRHVSDLQNPHNEHGRL